jgi:hypothetical protein
MRLKLENPSPTTHGSQPSSPSAGVRPRVMFPIWLSVDLPFDLIKASLLAKSDTVANQRCCLHAKTGTMPNAAV